MHGLRVVYWGPGMTGELVYESEAGDKEYGTRPVVYKELRIETIFPALQT